jgi:electron transfer flavoprotein alpha subunit
MVEHRDGHITPTLDATLTAARQLARLVARRSGSVALPAIHLVLAGPWEHPGEQLHDTVAQLARAPVVQGVAGIHVLPVPEGSMGASPPALATQLHRLWVTPESGWPLFSHLLAPATLEGRTLLSCLAGCFARAGQVIPLVTQVVSLLDADCFRCSSHAGNVWTTMKVTARDAAPVLLAIRPTAFAPPASSALSQPAVPVPVQVLPALDEATAGRFGQRIGWVATAPAVGRPELLGARIVVAGGQGVVASGSFRIVEQLADALGAAVGATRSAVDAGLAGHDQQIGQTGHGIAPEWYIALGISGSLQHMAGVKDARHIVAINHDPGAPIHAVADISWVADLFQAVPELIGALRAGSSG